MKKFYLIILSIFLFFSTLNANAKQEDLIEQMLNLNFWSQVFELNLKQLNNYNFKDVRLKKLYNTLKSYDRSIRKSVIKAYQNDDYDYYTINWIIKNYTQFISYTNDFFYYISLTDKDKSLLNDTEIQNAILYTFKNSNEYYKKVKRLIIK